MNLVSERIVWDNFEAAARTQARLQQMPDLEPVVVPHRPGALLTKLLEPI